MSAGILLAELRSLGVELSLKGDDIAYRAPAGVMTAALVSAVQAEKPRLRDRLREELTEPSQAGQPSVPHLDPRPEGLDHFLEALERDPAGWQHQAHPFARYVEPVKSSLWRRVGLDKEYVRGEGCYLWDEQGNQYLDGVAQYGGLPFGYNPPLIWEALDHVRRNQVPNVAATSMLGTAGRLAERLLRIAPPGMQHVIFCNSGAEAIEVAIKLCRASTNRPGILATLNGFHGLTTGSLATTGNPSFQDGFFVHGDNFHHVPFGDAEAVRKCLADRPHHFAAFIVEPIQGESGIRVPADGYLRHVRDICDEYDVRMVVDEVQTGLGRTGKMFGCDHDEVAPDAMTVAKALGGGLIPAAAVLCNERSYSARFGLRHSSTFAGNAVACQAGLATLDMLDRGGGELVRQVAYWGDYLGRGLQTLRDQHPDWIREVRGRGYMQAIEFGFEALDSREGLLPVLVDQRLLLYLMTSYLLMTHHVRVAPSFVTQDVIRIELPLIAGQAECDQLLRGLGETLDVVESGNAAALLAGMIPLEPMERQRILSHKVVRPPQVASAPRRPVANCVGEFGFLVHFSAEDDLVRFDPTLAAFTNDQRAQLRRELCRSSGPVMVGTNDFYSRQGIACRGHFVLVPHTPEELVRMGPAEAIQRVAEAADIAKEAGAAVIGLGGFTSIVTYGGLALDADRLPPITSGNAYTTATTIDAMEQLWCRRGAELADATIAIVGATGQIGRAVACLLAERGAKLILVGRDGQSPRTQSRLQELHQAIDAHLTRQQLQPLNGNSVVLSRELTDIAAADIVVAVSSAVEPFIQSRHLKAGALICDSARPANVAPEVIAEREDITWVEAGLVRMPEAGSLSLFAGPYPDRAYSCVAETALWILEPALGTPAAVGELDAGQIRALHEAGRRHGFEIVT